VIVPPGSLLLKGRKLRGTMGGDIAPTVFIPRLLDLHRQGRFPVDRLVKNYPFRGVNTAIRDSLSGATINPVLTFSRRTRPPVALLGHGRLGSWPPAPHFPALVCHSGRISPGTTQLSWAQPQGGAPGPGVIRPAAEADRCAHGHGLPR